MEAVPKLPFLSFELKVSPENTHFGPKLKQYIAEAYREDPDSYNNEMHQLEGLRSAAVRASLDSTGLAALIRYFCQLRAMQSRFPMAKGQPAAVSFTWKDLYANMNCSLSGIKFEMACILYNIGALHTQLGASEPRTTPDSLKATCQHFQNAAWAFQYLREQYPQPPGADVSTEILKMLQEICFAQAQECILDKSIQDTRKSSVVGAVATQVLYFYKNSLAHLGPSTGTDNIHEIIGTKLYNYWHHYLSFKSFYIGCIVCLYQGMHAEEQQKMGERVAFYQLAVERLAAARKLAKYIEPVQVTQEALTFTNDVVEGKRKAANNENVFIYHEEVPDKDLLSDLKPVCLVKALPINFNNPEVSGPDLFSRLVPMGAHEASSMYSEEKAKLLRQVVCQVEAKNTELTEFMSSLQLDQLDVLDADQKIPQEIVDRCAAMNAKTDIIQTLVESMNNLAEIISDVEHSLSDIKALIQEETLKEKEYQKAMGPRPPSIVQTEISREYHKYQEAHARTNESNQVLHKAMTLHIANLKLLSQPLDVLQSKIPSIENIEGLDRDAMQEMRRVVGKAREMQAQRESLVQQLRDDIAGDDVTAQLLARSGEPTDEIFKQEIEKHTPKVKIIEQNLAAQENIINKLTSLYASYGESRRLLSDVLRKREGLINALVTSYDTHGELLGKSQKGLEFYKKLGHNVGQLLARLKSTCQVQREERDQIMAKQALASPASSSPVPTAAAKAVDALPTTSTGSTLKLKDYLPYMINRTLNRKVPLPLQQPVEPMPPDTYYPETIYPTSVRPAPVGSEATDVTQMNLPDGVVIPQGMQPSPYARYAPYAPADTEQYNQAYYTKPFEKPGEIKNYNYSSYTPSQYTSQMADPQMYSNPYYSATQNNTTLVTDSQNMYTSVSQSSVNTNQYYDPHMTQAMPDVVPDYNVNQPELSANFAQMQVSVPKSEPYADYAPYYNPQYPQASTPMAYGQNTTPQMSTSNAPSSYGQNPAQTSTPNAMYATQNPTPQTSMPSASMYSGQNPTPQTSMPSASMYSGQNPTPQTSMPSASMYPGQNPTPQTSMYVGQNPNQQMPTSNTSMSYGQYPTPQTSMGYGQGQNSQTPNVQMYSEQNPNQTPTANTPTAHGQPTPPSSTENTMYGQNPTPQVPSDYSTNYPYTSDAMAQYQGQPTSNYSGQYAFTSAYENNAQGYVYTNAESSITSTTNASTVSMSTSQTYVPSESDPNYNPALAQLDALDKPIKSHVTGEALSSNIPNYQYNPTVNYSNEQTYQTPQYPDQTNANYATYQNHPGYTYNSASGSYDYNYGSQNTYTNSEQTIVESTNNQNWNAAGVYTSAGTCDTVQSPSETPQQPTNEQSNMQVYYNLPYGYQTATNQSNEVVPQTVPASTNYGANMNQSTYMQSGHLKDTNVTYTNNQVDSFPVSTTKENVIEPAVSNENVPKEETLPVEVKTSVNKTDEAKPEPSTFDLLSDIDFTVEHTPLMPEIKVPQISEKVFIKPTVMPRTEPIPKPPKEEILERPAKRDLFSDPTLLNKFTEEVKKLQKLTDSLTNKTSTGLTLLDTKWKSLQDVQGKENMTRSKTKAMEHSDGNIVTEVVPYDDSRLTLKSEPDVYINASYYKQLSPWCIPLVIAKGPSETDTGSFWKAMLENKITCVVCLLSEIEMQGKSYWPTAKGQTLELENGLRVTLEEVTCTVHWTERRLSLAIGKTVLNNVLHYQINVFPAKIVCSPLVLLADKVLSATYSGRVSNQLQGACVQCACGGGRSAVLALLLMALCQVRAGYLHLCDMLDSACVNLYKHRTNVLEDTKYLVDAYKTVLFYAQGVLCSGTTMFNGEAVSVPSGASVLPPVTPLPTTSCPNAQKPKFSKESFEEMRQSPGLKSGDMKDPLNFLDPLWSLKKK